MTLDRLGMTPAQIAAFCTRWKVRELAVFGSVLREDFGPHSDVDVLVGFSESAEWSLLDHARMQQELSELIGRPVDVLTRRAVESSPNWIRREAILSTAEVIHAA